MNLLKSHAYLLVGDREFWKSEIEKKLKEILKINNLASSPDIWWQSYESFGIKDAHALIEREARHGFGEKGRFFVLEISSITPEAQNALLKTFEEPADDAHFFIIARTAEIFLPTLRSRLTELRGETFHQLGGLASKLTSAKKFGQNEVGLQVPAPRSLGVVGSPKSDFVTANPFLKLDLPDRLDFIQKEFLPARKASPSDAGGKNKDVNKSAIIDFVIELEKTFRAKIDLKKITKDEELALRELEKCQCYLQNPRSSNRLILEHLALVIPLTTPAPPDL